MNKTMAAVARTGALVMEEVDLPSPAEHEVLIRTEYSAISTGTETKVLRGNANGTRLGYNSVGIIVKTGAWVEHLHVGQRVACYGSGAHAAYRTVPKFLAAPVPPDVDPEEAAFAGLGAIAIHSLRQAELQFGETAVIVGLGILGQITALIANAAAYRVVGYDLLPARAELLNATVRGAAAFCRAEEVGAAVAQGADGVLLVGGGGNDGLIDQGIGWLRDRGKIVIVGLPDTTFSRGPMFAKEAQIRISRAGGPGRYDPQYEQAGFDYPDGYVRWTEGRNVAEFVRLLENGRLTVKPLVRHRFAFRDIGKAFELCQNNPEETMGMLVHYD